MNSQGWLKWVIILVIIVAVVWLFLGRSSDNADVETGDDAASAVSADVSVTE